MSDYLNDTKTLINEITEITKQPLLKPLIEKLADHIADGLRKRKPEAINQSKMAIGNGKLSGEPENTVHVSKILKMLKDKYFSSVSDRYIEMCMKPEYKHSVRVQEKEFDIDIITDRDLIAKGPELMKKYKKLLDHGPAQDIKVKKSVDGIKNHDFKCDLTSVLVDIALNVEKDYVSGKLKDKTVKELVRRFKTISDKRFAVDECRYEAILLASSTVKSLNNATEFETEQLGRWELYDRERKCRKCYGDLEGCRADKCSCACHESLKHLTTKGLKWAKGHNPHLKKLDEAIETLSQWEDNICSVGKVIIRNPHTKDFMSMTDRKRILYDHIEKSDCDTCRFYLEDNPDFFDKQD